jgi:hypothetical protein
VLHGGYTAVRARADDGAIWITQLDLWIEGIRGSHAQLDLIAERSGELVVVLGTDDG